MKILLLLVVFILPTIAQSQEKIEDDTMGILHRYLLQKECGGGPKKEHLTAYPDYKGYSIGCGTPSYKGEKITEIEAIHRYYMYTEKRVQLVKKHFPDISGNKLIALVSLASNNGTCYYSFVRGTLSQYLWREKCDNVRVGGELKELPGLHIRRNEEADMYFLNKLPTWLEK